jgi:serine/threonine protein kinase
MYCTNISCPNPETETLGITNCPSCGNRLLLQYRYYATKLIGQGGFGRTYRAIDTHNSPGKLCVIKQFTFQSSNRSTNKTAIDLFYQEAEHLKSLGDHPQIPSLIDYFDAGSKSYLVQEYIDGENLEQELSIEGRFDQGQIREILESLLPVLDWLHHRSIPVIHRDIKPANIIRRRSDGKLVLVDFGAAKLASETLLAKTGTSIGSAEYAAPEQVRGKPTFASDIYSLGVTCIHLLTAIPPFDLYSVGENDWDWRSSLGSNKVDEKLGEVIDKMINPALSRRYRSALEALSALQNAQETFELDEVISQKALQMWMRTYPQGRIETIEWIDELLEKGLPLLPTVNSVALIGVSAIAIFVGQFPFQQMAVKYLSGSTGGISMIATSIVYGFSYSVVFVPCYQKARESCEIGDWGEMKKSIVIPWLALTLAHAVDVFLSSLIGGLRV